MGTKNISESESKKNSGITANESSIKFNCFKFRKFCKRSMSVQKCELSDRLCLPDSEQIYACLLLNFVTISTRPKFNCAKL